jgi:hypothetical protein
MKVVNIDNPVNASWLAEQGFRLDASPYLSGAYEARKLLNRLRTEPLGRVTQNIFHAGRVSRRWVNDREHGIPFFSSVDILEGDFSYLPFVARSLTDENPRLLIERDWVLITRSGTVGRIAYARPDVNGFACSEHVLRVVGDLGLIQPGYLYAYLQSRYGVPLIAGSAYGAIIQHIEPHHIAELPVPRFGDEVEGRIHGLIQQAVDLRAQFQAGVRDATRDLFSSAGLADLLDLQWHQQPRDLGFTVTGLTPTSLRALNFAPRARRILDAFRSVPHHTLGEICKGGGLHSGARFKRVETDERHGVRLIGQRQGFWLRPEGRWINPRLAPPGISAQDETVMIAAQGTLGENEVFCRVIFITGKWLEHAYTQHFLRAVSGSTEFPGAYLFAFLRSEPAFRILRSLSVGGKQQDIHEELRRHIPVPACNAADRERIAGTVRKAYQDRDEADRLEDEALALLDEAVREAAR